MKDWHFDLLLGEKTPQSNIKAPQYMVEEPEVIRLLAQTSKKNSLIITPNSWIILYDEKIVGLCSFKSVELNLKYAEIGYGVVEFMHNQGIASAAISQIIEKSRDMNIHRLIAKTEYNNIASQRVLENNNFKKTGDQIDSEDGKIFIWQLRL